MGEGVYDGAALYDEPAQWLEGMMRIGMIFECKKDGPDYRVCCHFAKRVRADIEIREVTLGDKATLVADCGKSADLLLKSGCERVLIIWDLRPAFPNGEKLDCVRECELVKDALTAAGVTSPKVYLVAIREELETWLIADKEAVRAYLKTNEHDVDLPKNWKKPENVKQPKAALNNQFQSSPRHHCRYSDMLHALPIARNCDLARLEKVQSFKRFADKVRG